MGTYALDDLHRLLYEVLETSQFAWWEWDVIDNRVIASDRKVTMLGYPPKSFRGAGYQAYMDLVHPDDAERTLQAMRDHLEGRAPLYQIDYRIQRADGDYTWYMDRGMILERTPNGHPARLRGIVIDLGGALDNASGESALVEELRRSLPSSSHADQSVVLCSNCLRLKFAHERWVSVDESFQHAFPSAVSHGICSDCIRHLYPEYSDRILTRLQNGN